MRIAELMRILQQHDRKTMVLVDSYEAGLCDIKVENIRLIRFDRDVITSSHSGPHKEHKEGKYTALVFGRG